VGFLHDIFPTQCGGVVLAAHGVRGNVGRAHGGVAEALGEGREVHAIGQQQARVLCRDHRSEAISQNASLRLIRTLE